MDQASGADGVKVATAPLAATVPATGTAPGPASVKVAVVTVAWSSASSKVPLTVPVTLTPVALFAGTVETSAGGETSGPSELAKTASTQ